MCRLKLTDFACFPVSDRKRIKSRALNARRKSLDNGTFLCLQFTRFGSQKCAILNYGRHKNPGEIMRVTRGATWSCCTKELCLFLFPPSRNIKRDRAVIHPAKRLGIHSDWVIISGQFVFLEIKSGSKTFAFELSMNTSPFISRASVHLSAKSLFQLFSSTMEST